MVSTLDEISVSRIAVANADDIICFGHSFEETFERLEEVFQCLKSANWKVKPKKCSFFQTEVSFLGFRLSAAGIQPAMNKIECIQGVSVPKNLIELRSFLGYLGFYCRF